MSLTATIITQRRARSGRPSRPRFQRRDVVHAPLHDLPIRDEIIYSYLPTSREMEIIEIGPGSGFSAFRLARLLKHLTVAEVAPENLVALCSALASVQNIDLIHADICDPLLTMHERRTFDAVEAVEVFEFVSDGPGTLANMAKLLRPGGLMFLQFPNYEPPRNKGVTFIRSRAELDSMLRNARFAHWQVYELRLRPWARFWYRILHEVPLSIVRSLRNRVASPKPLVYQDTWAFRQRHALERWKALIHIYWCTVMTIMRLGGRCFRRTKLDGELTNKNLLVLAWRGE